MSGQPVVDQETRERLEAMATKHLAVARPLDLQLLAQTVLAILERLDGE
jgi:hypothetical protein